VLPDSLRPAAEHYFGDRLPLVERYADLLATDGVLRGLIGPREVPRLWERHLLNSVALVERIPDGAVVADVGSGAGLPGVPLAVARPDLDVLLVEPQLRRTTFLEEVVQTLELERVKVVRARAEEAVRRFQPVDVVVARAVAPLGRLATWCLPLVVVGGRMLALKGASASDEVARDRAVVRRSGGADPALAHCGADWLESPVTVVEVVRERPGDTVSGRMTGMGGRPHGVDSRRGGRHR
jgi:16S rRNA (guanine527-N7)-methyltransferase